MFLRPRSEEGIAEARSSHLPRSDGGSVGRQAGQTGSKRAVCCSRLSSDSILLQHGSGIFSFGIVGVSTHDRGIIGDYVLYTSPQSAPALQHKKRRALRPRGICDYAAYASFKSGGVRHTQKGGYRTHTRQSSVLKKLFFLHPGSFLPTRFSCASFFFNKR